MHKISCTGKEKELSTGKASAYLHVFLLRQNANYGLKMVVMMTMMTMKGREGGGLLGNIRRRESSVDDGCTCRAAQLSYEE